jgi:hypothetical protein
MFGANQLLCKQLNHLIKIIREQSDQNTKAIPSLSTTLTQDLFLFNI